LSQINSSVLILIFTKKGIYAEIKVSSKHLQKLIKVAFFKAQHLFNDQYSRKLFECLIDFERVGFNSNFNLARLQASILLFSFYDKFFQIPAFLNCQGTFSTFLFLELSSKKKESHGLKYSSGFQFKMGEMITIQALKKFIARYLLRKNIL